MLSYGELIKKLRKERNLSLRDFSKLVGVSFSHVRYLEKEKVGDVKLSPDIEMLKQICDRTGYPFRQFLEEAGYIEPVESLVIIDEPHIPQKLVSLWSELDKDDESAVLNLIENYIKTVKILK